MTMTEDHDNPIRPEDLVAHAEGRLPVGSILRERVEEYLRCHPAEAERAAAYRRQDALLHEAFDGILDQSLPARLQDSLRQSRRRERPNLAMAASLVVGIALGLLVAQFDPLSLHEGIDGPNAEPRADSTIGTGTAEETDTATASVDANMFLAQNAPDLSAAGLTATGNIALENPATGLRRYEYRDTNGNQLQLLVSRESKVDPASVYTLRNGKFALAYWRQGDRTYLLTGTTDPDHLQSLAHESMATLQPDASPAGDDTSSGSGVVAGSQGENGTIGNGTTVEEPKEPAPVSDQM